MMKAEISNRIAPPTQAAVNPVTDVAVKEPEKAIDSNAAPKVDFGKLMNNSNAEIQREREAKLKGDYSNLSKDELLQRLNEQTSKEFKTPKNKLDKDDFLRLFVEQMKNQDPLNPDDGAELAAKLAQFNSVEQMMAMNKSLASMAKEQSTDRSLMMTNFIGKEMQINGGRFENKDGIRPQGEFTTKRPAADVTVQIRDESGQLAHEVKVGMLDAGVHELPWDGKDHKGQALPNGIYSFQIVANDVDGQPVPVDIRSKVRVMGVDVSDKDGLLYTNLGQVKLSDIASIGEDGFSQHIALKKGASAKPGASQPSPKTEAAGATGSPSGAVPPSQAVSPASTTQTANQKASSQDSQDSKPKTAGNDQESAKPSEPAVPNFRFRVPNPAPSYPEPQV